MNSLDPVQFTKRYLQEVAVSQKGSGGELTATDAPRDEVLWYNPDSKSISGTPPSADVFSHDIQKLQSQNAPERTINSYCGLSLLLAVKSAMNAAPGPLFAGIAADVGKILAGEAMEKEIGRKAEMEIIGGSGISKDSTLVSRFETVAEKLLAHSSLSGKEYRLSVLNSDEINAHSVPGHLFVTKGMLEQFPDDGELALFVGHEIGHAEDRDSIESIGQGMFDQLAIGSTLLKSKVKVEGTEQTIGDYRKELKGSFYDSKLAFDRSNETAADRRGAELALSAGFSPESARSAITKICGVEDEFRLKNIRDQVFQKFGFHDEAQIALKLAELKKLDNHPDVNERLKAVEEGQAAFRQVRVHQIVQNLEVPQ